MLIKLFENLDFGQNFGKIPTFVRIYKSLDFSKKKIEKGRIFFNLQKSRL